MDRAAAVSRLLREAAETRPVRSHLVFELVRLDREFTEQQPGGAWEDHYAAALLERFGSA